MKSNLLQVKHIKKIVDKINSGLGLNQSELPSYGKPNDNNPTFVMVNKDGYSFYEFNPYHDKTQQHLIIKTLHINELIFEIFKHSTFFLCVEYEYNNRIPNQDSRILIFKKHIEILSSLDLDQDNISSLETKYK